MRKEEDERGRRKKGGTKKERSRSPRNLQTTTGSRHNKQSNKHLNW
jgi:hypothetical protein